MASPLLLSSVPAQTPYVQYVATASQTVFPYPFEITQDSDLVCLVNGAQLGTDVGYTLSGQGTTGGGNLTFTLGQTAGTIVTIYRNIQIARSSQIPQNGGFFSSTFNNEYNRTYLIMQQLQQATTFCLRLPITNTPSGAGPVLLPSSYANKYLAFDSNGNPEPAALTSSGALTQSLIGQLLYPQVTASEVAASVTPTNYAYPPNHVRRYGAVGDGLTDDTAAFNTAAAVAVYSGEVYIDPASPKYYRLNSTWTLVGLPPGTIVHGAGLASIIVNANTAGATGIINSGNIHLCFKDFGIYGTSAAGDNLDNQNAAHYTDHINVWSGFSAGACFKNTQGISARYDHCQADDNNAFRPITLLGGLVDGLPNYGFWIPSDAGSLNNNPTFIDCRANAVGAICNVQIGTSGGPPVQTFHWFGGLIQGSRAYTEFYLVTEDSSIEGAHIEPIPGNTTGWIGTMDGCINTVVRDTVVEGDVRFINDCANCGYENLTAAGFDIGVGSTNCFLRDLSAGNIQTGPASGLIKDRGTNTDIRRITGSAHVNVGENVRNASSYFQSSMQEWVGGGSPTVPCGFALRGSGTVSQSTAQVYSGTYSCKVIIGTNLADGFAITLAPGNEIAGKNITVEAWVYNVTTPGLAYIEGIEGGTFASYQQASFQAGVWERMYVTFTPGASATSVQINFTGLVGTMYWGPIKITLEDHTPITELLVDTTAIPQISYPLGDFGGYPVRRLIIPASATAITNFLNPSYGHYDLVWTGNRTITSNSNIVVTAGTTAGTAGLTMRLTYGSDGVFRQI